MRRIAATSGTRVLLDDREQQPWHVSIVLRPVLESQSVFSPSSRLPGREFSLYHPTGRIQGIRNLRRQLVQKVTCCLSVS